ncbi:TetR/AcrR family transcriptional regulator [Nannocystis punicea]|uniref:TetR/AcrR family transcriptional regulator n=1 Tax=Nannocystis punicea TaxID=2995304 RepID=A0ABY7HAF4_9BACT|nr:TetR/AcrR family transcriptional regulator [Nannocystis poenicansa]WAS96232.1 TetR/AcrR family transcriptional regulator [Nannocystis poenicansa]
MPYTAEHKARTRERIVMAARELFNRHGFESVSIDQIMARAKLTRGGFYNHFPSKAALYAEAVQSFTDQNPFALRLARWKRPLPEPRKLARMLVESYLSDEVLDDADLHCPLYALPSDVVRAGPEPQAAYTAVLRSMSAILRNALPDDVPDAEARVHLIVTLCVGSMIIARTTHDPALGRSIRNVARKQALALLAT